MTFAALLGVFSTSAWAQATTGSMYGTVTDQSNAAIPGAAVKATQVETGATQTVESNGSGNYVFSTLPPGDYTISTQVSGFSTQVQKDIRLDANQNVHVNFLLKPGATSQTVTVSASTTLVDTRESQLGETVDEKRIQELPLNGRNAYSLVQIMPGITNFKSAAAIGDQTGSNFSANGLRTYYNTVYLDGALDTTAFRDSGNLIPNPDALQEFRLLSSNFDAEFGRSPGGVVNGITRSGTNNYHGVLYDYFRNNVLNAKSYFDNNVTPLKQNQFGANFGGPIFQNKAFFFGSYEGLRIRTPATISSASLVTPTPQEAAGNFSLEDAKFWPKQSNGAYYRCNGVDGVICPNLLDPVAQNVLKYVPLANATTGATPEQDAPANTNADQGLGRVDYQLSSSHRLSAMVFMSRGTSVVPATGQNQILDYSGNVNNNSQTNVVLTDAWIISPNALNTLRLMYTRNHAVNTGIFDGPSFADLGSKAVAGSTIVFNQPAFRITGYFSAGSDGSGPVNVSSWEPGISDTFNWTRKNHTIKLGGSFVFVKYAETGVFNSGATASFNGGVTGNALADFLLGRANTWVINSGAQHRFRAVDPALFMQDTWRANQRLTLNMGLRWEVFPPYHGENNTGTFEPYVQSKRFPTAPLGLVSSGDPGVPDGIMHTSWKDFAPRVGFAYDVFGNGLTALRGGYGVFYAADEEPLVGNIVQQPFVQNVTVNKTPNLVDPYAPNPDPFPYSANPEDAVFTPGATILSLSPGASVPYVQEYNLTLERQLGGQWGLRVAYVGNVTRKGFLARDANSPIYKPGLPPSATTTAGLNARRPYQPTPSTYVFGQIKEECSCSSGSYNSIQTTLTKRFSNGFSLLASYVWSKDMDIATNEPGNLNLTDNNDPARDYGKADLDVPQVFVASYLWTVPGVQRWGFVGRQVLSGWQLNGITTLSSGGAFNITSGKDTNLDGNNNDRPNLVGNPILSGQGRQAKILHFFNTASFAQLPANMPYGSVQRNLLIGPGYVNTDFSAFKSFPMWEKGTLQFRGEIFNLFNNVNLNNPTAVLTSKIFGKIGGSNSPRIVQFALRYSF